MNLSISVDYTSTYQRSWSVLISFNSHASMIFRISSFYTNIMRYSFVAAVGAVVVAFSY